jgi:hypothetical protein
MISRMTGKMRSKNSNDKNYFSIPPSAELAKGFSLIPSFIVLPH